ncbi:MAG: YgaP family membrane protein [Bdellovibrionota bacterium]
MRQNIGTAEKVIRAALGIAVLSLVFLGPQTAWGYLGLIAILSAASGFCPLYAVHRRRKARTLGNLSSIEKECWDREGRWGLCQETEKTAAPKQRTN